MKEKKNNLFKDYWYLWLIVIIIPPFLYWVIKLPFGFNAIGGEDAPKEWLGFWGAYLGSIITSAVTFIILYKQLESNKKENENNRKENEKQNEENRELQIKILKHQSETEWLNNFKKVATEYITIYSNNNLLIAQNSLRNNPKESYDIARHILHDMCKAKTEMEFYKRDCQNAKTTYDALDVLYNKFNHVVLDMYYLANSMMEYPNEKADSPVLIVRILNEIHKVNGVFSDDMRSLANMNNGFPKVPDWMEQRCQSVEDISKKVSDLLINYVSNEQERINNILQL